MAAAIRRICFVQLILPARARVRGLARVTHRPLRYFANFLFAPSVIDASIYPSGELARLIKKLDKEGHDGAE